MNPTTQWPREPDDATRPARAPRTGPSLLVGFAGSTLVCETLDDLAHLIGRTAPSAWRGVGVIAVARADSRDIHLIHRVDRDGGSATAMVRRGEITRLTDATGPIDDLCRRLLGMATPGAPPLDAATRRAWWCDRVLDDTLRRPVGDPPSPARVAELRPPPVGWHEVHRRCATGGLEVPGLTRDMAAWFDTGAFARWVQRSLPDVDQTLPDLVTLLGVETVRPLTVPEP